MRIALFVPGGVDRSGTDRVIPVLLALIERLSRRHAVVVLALTPTPAIGRYELLGATVHDIGGGAGRRRRALAVLADEHRRRPFDVFHAFWVLGTGSTAAIAGWRFRVPVVLHMTGAEMVSIPDIGYGQRRTARGRLVLRLAVAGAQRVTVTSAPMAETAAALGIAARRIPLGIALDRWPPAPPRPRDMTQPARLLHIADLNRVKDQGMLLRAAALLSRMDVPFQLDIAGYDTLGGDVQQTAQQLGLSDCITFHGKLRYNDLHALASRADLHLMSSRHEAGPAAVLEAAVAGLPTVGTRVGHVAEWAPDAAVAVPIGDAESMACAVASVLANDDYRMRLAAAAHRRALAENADVTARLFEELYDEVAQS
ncbi:MAG TPA: glycosyltransferase [Gemmatimonadaceae bacterium]|jgi:glycosyltransferase involved in cell wall biosynthesis|nr:glycosyltransferase [Gemmatimonadaceae bacterium]